MGPFDRFAHSFNAKPEEEKAVEDEEEAKHP